MLIIHTEMSKPLEKLHIKPYYVRNNIVFTADYIVSVMGCGGHPTHRHHYLKSVFAATSLDNIMTYIYMYVYI